MIINIYVIHPLTNGGHDSRLAKATVANLNSISAHCRLIIRELVLLGVDLRTIRIQSPQLEWEPLLDILDYDIALDWCMDKLDSADVAYQPIARLAADPPNQLLHPTPGVDRERKWCNELISDGITEHRRKHVFDDAKKLAQWISDKQNDSETNQED